MKHIIKKILKEESLKQTLKQQVKEFGFKDTAELVGGTENLVKLGFNNNPMEFLHLFDDLDVVQSEEKQDWTLFRYKKHKNLMIYDRKNEIVYINYYEIWSVLEDKFGLKYSETQRLTKIWLDEVYNLKGVTLLLTEKDALLKVG
jgi:1-aminocyclopropane-1-carboxylate deaminase/D-cysteine desulfhydrase-like pyridoxal-dependent ACC family enzyme